MAIMGSNKNAALKSGAEKQLQNAKKLEKEPGFSAELQGPPTLDAIKLYKETPLAQSQVKRDIAKAKFEAAVNESWKILNHRTENLQITLSSKDSESINKLNIDELAKDYNKTNIQYLIEKSSLEYLAKQ